MVVECATIPCVSVRMDGAVPTAIKSFLVPMPATIAESVAMVSVRVRLDIKETIAPLR